MPTAPRKVGLHLAEEGGLLGRVGLGARGGGEGVVDEEEVDVGEAELLQGGGEGLGGGRNHGLSVLVVTQRGSLAGCWRHGWRCLVLLRCCTLVTAGGSCPR